MLVCPTITISIPEKKVGETHQPTSHLICIIKKYVSASVVKACVKIQHFKLCQSIYAAAVFTAWTFVGTRCMSNKSLSCILLFHCHYIINGKCSLIKRKCRWWINYVRNKLIQQSALSDNTSSACSATKGNSNLTLLNSL